MIDKDSQLANLFKNQQQKMKIDLETSSCMFHPVDNGDHSENAWIQFFEKYLPKDTKLPKQP